MRKAFTLAEVLITLGIIGVVAAMTMPSLINNYQQKQYEAKYAKAKNIMANAINLMMAQNNVFDIADLPLVSCADDACRNAELAKVFKNYQGGIDPSTLPQKYKKNDTVTNGVNDNIMDWTSWNINDIFFPPAYAKIVSGGGVASGDDDMIDAGTSGGGLHGGNNISGFSWTIPEYIFRVQDGIVFGILVPKNLKQAVQTPDLMLQNATQTNEISTQAMVVDHDVTSVASIAVYVDINGSKSPNTVGKDLFYFTLSGKNQFKDMSGTLNSIMTSGGSDYGLLQ